MPAVVVEVLGADQFARNCSSVAIKGDVVVFGNSIHLPALRGTMIEVEKPTQPLRAAHGTSLVR